MTSPQTPRWSDRAQSGKLCYEEEEILKVVGKVVAERIAPRAERYDASSEFPWDNIRDLNVLELNKILIPEEYGGIGASYRCFLRIVQALSSGCASTGIIWATTFHAIMPIIDFGTDEQKKAVLPRIAAGGLAAIAITEEGAGSDASNMRTSFAPHGDKIRVNGTKAFITSGDVADLCLVFGNWGEGTTRPRGLSAVIVERDNPGYTVIATEKKLGHRASSTVRLAFDDCLIPQENLLGRPGDGFMILLAALNRSRPSTAAQALGIARAAFDEAVGYVNERVQFGGPLLDLEGVQFKIADMAVALALAESWLWHVGTLIDEGNKNFAVEASIAKLTASDAAMKIALDALQLHGGYGYCVGARVERLFRDAKVTQIWEGANEVHRQFIGRSFRNRGESGAGRHYGEDAAAFVGGEGGAR